MKTRKTHGQHRQLQNTSQPQPLQLPSAGQAPEDVVIFELPHYEVNRGSHTMKNIGIFVLLFHPSAQNYKGIYSFLAFFFHFLHLFTPPFSKIVLLLPKNTISKVQRC